VFTADCALSRKPAMWFGNSIDSLPSPPAWSEKGAGGVLRPAKSVYRVCGGFGGDDGWDAGKPALPRNGADMLVLQRGPHTSIMIGDEIRLYVTRVRHGVHVEISGPIPYPGRYRLCVGDSVPITPEITVLALRINGDKVRIGVDAPRSVTLHRREVWERLRSRLAVVG
jgi:carbon storage regulator CsrA